MFAGLIPVVQVRAQSPSVKPRISNPEHFFFTCYGYLLGFTLIHHITERKVCHLKMQHSVFPSTSNNSIERKKKLKKSWIENPRNTSSLNRQYSVLLDKTITQRGAIWTCSLNVCTSNALDTVCTHSERSYLVQESTMWVVLRCDCKLRRSGTTAYNWP